MRDLPRFIVREIARLATGIPIPPSISRGGRWLGRRFVRSNRPPGGVLAYQESFSA